MEAKKDIRNSVLKKRTALNKKEWEEKSHKIFEKVTAHPFFLMSDEIYCYVDFRNEVGTKELIEKAWSLKKKVAVPKIENKDMQFYYISSWEDLSEGSWGILEPHTLQEANGANVCVIMPGAVFDRNGNRIGYGGGYYDSYLESHPNFRTIAIAFELQVIDEVPAEAHDIKPQYIITEVNTYDSEFAK